MKGDVGMSHHEKGGKQEDAYTKTEIHSQPHPYTCCFAGCECNIKEENCSLYGY